MSDVLFLNAVPQSPFTSLFRLLSVIILHTRHQYSSSGCKKEELFQHWKYTMRGILLQEIRNIEHVLAG
jgi:hypothetical protein